MKDIKFDYNKLKGRIKEYLGTQDKLATLLDVDETTISNKLNSKTYFTQLEIMKMCEALNIEDCEIRDIFFKQEVRKLEQNRG